MIALQTSIDFWVWIYCLVLVFIVAFVVINLLLAIIAINFLILQDNVNKFYKSNIKMIKF